MNILRRRILALRKLLPESGVLTSCRTDLARQKFAESQISLSNSLVTGGMLSALALLATASNRSRVDGFFLLWSFCTLFIFVFSSAIRQRGLRLIDLVELKKNRRPGNPTC